MTAKPRDPLLAAAKVLVVIAQIVMVFGAVVLGIALVALFTAGFDYLTAELAKDGVPMAAGWLIGLAMLTGIGLLALGYRFFGELRGIIDSVWAGDPFHPDNARRLSRMGWITVAVQLLILPVGALALWLAPMLEKSEHHIRVDGGLDGGGILLTLILFILARVFREGTRLRDEVEGTV